MEDSMSAIAKIIETGTKFASKRMQQMTSDLLVKLGDSLAVTANDSSETIPEARVKGDGRHILGVVGDILAMQEGAPVSRWRDVDADGQIVDNLQKTVKSVGDALLVTGLPGEVISLDTPKVELRAMKTTGEEPKPQSIAFSNVTIDLPEGFGGEEATSVSAVATPSNPLWHAPTDFASGFITL